VTATAPAVDGAAPRATSSKQAGALVVGGDYRALGVVRSLGRRGIAVWVVAQRDERLAAHSRYARRTIRVDDVASPALVARLLELSEHGGLRGWVLIPSGDESAALLARNHEALADRFVLTVPGWDTFRRLYDKRLTYELADETGVDHPWTVYPRSRAEVETIDAPFPVILKPAVKPSFNRLTAAKAWPARDRAELLERYDAALALVEADTLMVQEVVPGAGDAQLSFAALCEEGRVLASSVAQRTRQYPADFGRASTFVETVELPSVEEPARKLLEAVHYTGLAEVEFKRDPRSGRLLLLDINPRVWGWHTLCGRAGVDFPYLLFRAATGERVPASHTRAGARWVRLSTDLPTSCREILGRRLSARAYLRSLLGPVEGAVFQRDDPLPGLLELPLLASLALKRLVAGKGV
jgi:D-aspartate ligase